MLVSRPASNPKATYFVAALLCVGSGALPAVPEGWAMTEFASPPDIEYPTAISASADGDLYVSSDPNGSLGHNPEFGKIVRARDTDGDGRADEFQDFVPNVTSPRGGHMVGGTFYLIHPPYLSAFRDTTGDGVADERRELVKGFGWGVEHPRGADHTTNGVRMGIDGWLYVAVGDYGMPDAVGADGTHYTLRGGGVVRVRPDGSEMEPYSLYTRNICDVAITPTLDMFSRDNTNDGKGWNTRFHHFVPMGDHGYPRLYKHFPEETVMALKDFGGGSGTGALALNEPGFPPEFDNAIFTGDWTTGNVYLHPVVAMEATYEIGQKVFQKLPRAVDLDVDGESRMYLADWRNGKFDYDANERVGMIQQVRPPGWEERSFPDLRAMADVDLVEQIGSDSAVMRLEAQREVISRGEKEVFRKRLIELAGDGDTHLFKRVAAIFTFKQLYGAAGNKELAGFAGDAEVREYILRALADRKSQLGDVSPELFVKYLRDGNPRVRVQALNGLARMGAEGAAPAILSSVAGVDLDPGTIDQSERRVVPHVAIKTLVALGAEEACLEAVNDSQTRAVAFRALQEMHTLRVVDGLISKMNENPGITEGVLGVLARLYHKEGEWDLEEWWNTRPDDRGPYYHPVEWEGTAKVRKALEESFGKISEEKRSEMVSLVSRNRISISDLDLPGLDPLIVALGVEIPEDGDIVVLVDGAKDSGRAWSQRLLAYQAIDKAPPEKAVPAQVEILGAWLTGNVPEAESMVVDFVNQSTRGTEVVVLNRIAKKRGDIESMIAWKALLTVLNSPLAKDQHKARVRKLLNANPMEVGLYLAIEDMKIGGFDQQIAAGIGSDNRKTIEAAKRARNAAPQSGGAGMKVGETSIGETRKAAMDTRGDVRNGERLYVSQGCISCHAIEPDAVQKGPYLGSAGAKFEREYLIESILDPNAIVAQGFQTVLFTLEDGTTTMGFVTREEDDLIEVRDIAGHVSRIKRSEVKEENHLPHSMMPPGLVNSLSIKEFADLTEYLTSLKNIGG